MDYVISDYRDTRINKLKQVLYDETRWFENERGEWYTIFVPPIYDSIFIEREELIKNIEKLEKEKAQIDDYRKDFFEKCTPDAWAKWKRYQDEIDGGNVKCN